MGKLSLCSKVCPDTIPVYEVNSHDELENYVENFLKSKNDFTNVYVCFMKYEKAKEINNEFSKFTITHNQEVITWDEMEWLASFNIDNIYYCIFEFENYQQAFDYCKELKESF